VVQYPTDDSKECHKVTIKCRAYGKTSLEAAENAKRPSNGLRKKHKRLEVLRGRKIMNVDIYCKHCFKVIEVICTNLLVYEHSIHDKEYENISCNKCFSNEHVVVRCYIPRKDVANAMEVDERDTGEQQIIRVVPLVG